MIFYKRVIGFVRDRSEGILDIGMFYQIGGCGGDQVTSRVSDPILRRASVPDSGQVNDSRVLTGALTGEEGASAWPDATN